MHTKKALCLVRAEAARTFDRPFRLDFSERT